MTNPDSYSALVEAHGPGFLVGIDHAVAMLNVMRSDRTLDNWHEVIALDGPPEELGLRIALMSVLNNAMRDLDKYAPYSKDRFIESCVLVLGGPTDVVDR